MRIPKGRIHSLRSQEAEKPGSARTPRQGFVEVWWFGLLTFRSLGSVHGDEFLATRPWESGAHSQAMASSAPPERPKIWCPPEGPAGAAPCLFSPQSTQDSQGADKPVLLHSVKEEIADDGHGAVPHPGDQELVRKSPCRDSGQKWSIVEIQAGVLDFKTFWHRSSRCRHGVYDNISATESEYLHIRASSRQRVGYLLQYSGS